MDNKIIRYMAGILFSVLFTISGAVWAGNQMPSSYPGSGLQSSDNPVINEKPKSDVTVSGVVYRGPNPKVMVSTVVYIGNKAKEAGASGMEMTGKGKYMTPQVKIVLLSRGNRKFKVNTRVPLMVNVINPPESEVKPYFEFQLLNGRSWHKIPGQRVSGSGVKRFKNRITLVRYAWFRKIGTYRWRCRINQRALSVWSSPVKIINTNTRAGSSKVTPGKAVPARRKPLRSRQ